jgi:hypothetical protein
MLALASAAEVAPRHRVAELTFANPAKVTTAQPAAGPTAATTCKRVGRNASASHRHGGNDDRDSVQHELTLHMPRSAGCDSGPLMTGACSGTVSGAGIRLSKAGIAASRVRTWPGRAATSGTTGVSVARDWSPTPITESIPTTVCGSERNRVGGQSPGESRSRSQNNHCLA